MSAISSLKESLSFSLVLKLASVIFTLVSARFMGVASFGEMFVSQQLLVSLSLFFLKETFRREAQRTDLSTVFAWLSVVCTIVLSFSLGVCWIHFLAANHFVVAILVLAVSCEAFAEPWLYMRLQRADYACKIRAETVSNLVRSIALAFIVYFGGSQFEKSSFALAQLCFSVSWCTLIMDRSWPALGIPSSLPSGFLTLLSLSCVKLILTEIEKFFLLAWFDSSAWAQFGIVSNFGSLILRTFFAPIEDVAFSAFSRGDFASLVPIFFLQTAVGLAAAAFGPAIAPEAVLVLYGNFWASQAGVIQLLRFYCILIFLCAVNGITEAHFFATAPPEKLKNAHSRQTVAAAVQILTSFAFSKFGPVALVFGNSAGMIVRIICCWTSLFTDVIKTNQSSYLAIIIGGILSITLAFAEISPVTRVCAVVVIALLSLTPAIRQLWIFSKKLD